MKRPQLIGVLIIGFLVVVGGAMLAIYLLLGGEGESVDVPGSEVVTSRVG